jgi:hypothetical protein
MSLAWHPALHSQVKTKRRRSAMKTIVSALIACAVLGLVAPPASAFDGKTFWEQQERTLP